MFYRLVRAFLRLVFKIYFRWQIEGEDNVPTSGGAVLAGNHVSYLDPPVMGCATTRIVHFMAKAELFRVPVLAPVIKALNAFPVDRGRGDRKAIRRAIELLKSGEVIGIFPEGTRSRDGNLQKIQLGAILIAHKAGAPIVPVAIIGTERVVPKGKIFPRPAKVVVRFGEPIDVPRATRMDKEALQETGQQVMQSIADLLVA